MNTGITLTPNRRLARFLREHQSAKILSWNDWLVEIWQTEYEWINQKNPLHCLSDWQSLVLWEAIISQHQQDPLLNQAQAVTHARAAWSLAIQWQCDPSQWQGIKHETDTFLHWLSAYQQYCHEHNYLDRTALPQVLLKYWQIQPDRIPSQIRLTGFDELTPLQASMIALWQSKGKDVCIDPPPKEAKPYTYVAFPDRTSQLTQAALYAKRALSTKPELPIGIIIPAIQDDWTNINDTFTAILGPDQPFNISAGQPLGQCPIIHAALQCLQVQSIHYLLTTPFIRGGLSEQSARALCDQKLLAFEKEVLPTNFIREYQGLPQQFSAILNQTLDMTIQMESVHLLPCEWIEKIFALLNAWGWPGDRPLSSEAYQAVKHFYGVITELSSLDEILHNCSYQKILSLLSRRVHQTMFQAESQDKPIQVLGFLEAAGLSFSHLWVMDMGNDTWPSRPAPNPYIPQDIQIKLGIPHASFARELRFAQTMTQRMLCCADSLIMSFAEHADEGEASVLPTPLLNQNPIAASDWEEQTYTPLMQALFYSRKLEPMPTIKGLPLQHFQVKGGANVFADQSDCPFRSYARHRLRAKSLERSVMGLSFRVKGNVLHEVLERTWNQLKNREALLRLSQSTLSEQLLDNIKSVLNQLQPPLSSIDRDLEVARMLPLLLDWFTHEINRESFQIQALEKHLEVTFEGLRMKVRIDRIDNVQGQICIIDYKTGKLDAYDWDHPRLDYPQLPFYACSTELDPQAIVFAQIRKDKMGWKGLGTWDVQGVTVVEPEQWSEQIAQWKMALKDLADEYKLGHAEPTPKRGSVTCQHCDLQPFCRINHAH